MSEDASMTVPEITRTLNRIEQKLDQVTGDHEVRLRRVEQALWVMAGLAAAGATSGIGALLTGILR